MRLLQQIFPGRKLVGPARQTRGFAIAPILYLLGLIGVGAGVLFSGYSQILRTNQNMSNTLAAKNDLQGSATTLAASSWLSRDQTRLCPPIVGSGIPDKPSPGCSTAVGAITVGTAFAHASAANLPAGYALVDGSGSPIEVGVFAAGAGVKVLDPWGHYYIYCRWENPIGTANALMVISAGPSGKLQTRCGDSAAKGDNLFVAWTTAVTQNHAAVWQTVTSGSSITGVQFGATGSQLNIDTNGDVSIPGTLGVTGATTLGNGGLAVNGVSSFAGGLVATTGMFNDGVTSTSGSFSGPVTGTSATFNSTLAAGTSTLSSLSVTNDATVGGPTTLTGALTANSTVVIGNSVAASGKPSALLSVGKPLSNVPPFSVDQYGDTNVSGLMNVSGQTSLSGALNVSGATTLSDQLTANGMVTINGPATMANTLEVKNNTTLDSNLTTNGQATIGGSLTVAGASNFTGAVSGSTGTFTGTVTASNFVGKITLGNGSNGGSGVGLTGIVPIENGGTGEGTAAGALTNMFGLAGVLQQMIPGADIVDKSITLQQIQDTTVVPGTYSEFTVESDGRITWGGLASAINDGNGDSIGVGAGGQVYTVGSAEVGNWTSTGLMVGSSSPALDKLDVYGATAIGSSYAGTNAAPANGLLVQGQVAIGTSTPLGALNVNGATNINGATNVNGTMTATAFIGDGYGITDLNPSAITGTVAPSNGGTGTNTVFTQGSVVFVGTSGIYVQDNPNFFFNDATHALGIGTNVLAGNNLDVNGNAAIGTYTGTAAPTNGLIVSGNVGIGTSSPLNALDVNGSEAVGSYAGFAGPTNSLIVSGKVGIGTSNPLSNFVVHAATGQNLFVGGAKNFGGGFDLSSTNDAGNASAPMELDATSMELNATNVGIGTATIANLLDVNGAASIGYINTVAPANGLLVNGHVGIGTTSPASMLHIFNGEVQVGSSNLSCATANAGAIRYAAGNLYYCDNTSTWEQLDSSGADNGGDYMTATQSTLPTSGEGMYGGSPIFGALISGYGSTSDVTLANKSGTPALELMTGTTNVYMPGSVGIGTSLPGAMFTVGNNAFEVAATGAVTVGNNAFTVAATGATTVANQINMTNSALTIQSAGTLIANGGTTFGVQSTQAPFAAWNGVGYGGFSDAGVTQTLQLSDATSANSYFNNGGNVGIGKANPSYTLDVTGTERVTGNVGIGVTPGIAQLAVTDATNGQGLYVSQTMATGTDYAIDAIAAGHSTLNIGGYFAAQNAISNYAIQIPSGYPAAGAGNYAIYSQSAAQSSFAGNVAIGTASPVNKLELYNTGDVYTDWFSGGSSAQAGNEGNGLALISTNQMQFLTGGTGFVADGAAPTANGAAAAVTISNSQQVGIGTATMANRLEVNGATSIGYVDTAAPSNGLIVSGNVGVNTATPDRTFEVNGIAHLGNDLYMLRTDGATAAAITTDNSTTTAINIEKSGGGNINNIGLYATTVYAPGNVGINKVNPAYNLDVAGTIQATNAGNNGIIGNGPSTGSSYYGGYFTAGSFSAGLARADGYSFVGTGTLYNSGSIQQVGGGTSTFSGPVGIGTASTAGYELYVNGTEWATEYYGNGGGLTNLQTSALTGTAGTGNGGTGTNSTFTQGSVVFAGAGGVYAQDNGNFYWNDASHELGIGETPGEPLDVNGIIRGNNEIISSAITGAGNIRMIGGNYGAFFRNDGANTYFLLTASGSQYGSWNSLRPLYISDVTGAVTIDGTGAGSNFGGSVGIGTASPTGLLDVNGTLTAGGWNAGAVGTAQIYNPGTSPVSVRQTFGTDGTGWQYRIAKNQAGTVTDLMTIVDSGDVGVGTVAPASALDVFGAATGNGQTSQGAMIFRAQDGASRPAIAAYGNIDGTALADGTASALAVREVSGTGRSITTSGTIAVGGAGGTGTSYILGNLGVNTAGPQANLDVPGTAHITSLNLDASSSGSFGGSDFWIGRGGASGGTNMALNGGSTGIELDTSNSARMFISGAGNVGVNTTSMTTNFNVGGSEYATANVVANGCLAATNGGGYNCNGNTLYVNGTADVTGAMTDNGLFYAAGGMEFPENSWMYAPGGVGRSWNIGASDMYWELGGNGSFHFRNSSDADQFVIQNNGNLGWAAANPTLSSGGSYFVIPNGIYVSGGTPYFQPQIQARGGVHNDSAGYLELDGGTSSVTYVNGSLGIAKTNPGTALDVNGTVQASNASNHGVIGTGPSTGSSYYGGYFSSGSYNAGLGRADGYSFVGNGTLYNNGPIAQVGGGTNTFSGSLNLQGGLDVGNVEQLYGTYIWPGRNDGSNANYQTSWYLASNGSYGLYSNTGLYLAGQIWTSILYDNANTGYYVQPHATSNMNQLNLGILYDNANTNYYVQPSQTSMFNSVQALIYYDKANTGYYMQPHATSVMNQVNVNSVADNANTGYYLTPHAGSRLQSAYFDGTLINWSGYNGITQAYGTYIWPGRNDGSGTNWQQSWYLASNSSYGLYSNTGLYLSGNLVMSGGGQFATNGDHYMAWAGVWASSWLNQSVANGASPTFGNVYLNYLGWISNFLNQNVTSGASPSFTSITGMYGANGGGVGSVAYGVAFDGTNILLRSPSTSGGTYVQDNAGGASWAEIGRPWGGIHSEGVVNAAGDIHAGGNLYADGNNVHLGYLNDWLSNYLNQSVVNGANPTFGNVYLNYGPGWISNWLNQSVANGAQPTFGNVYLNYGPGWISNWLNQSVASGASPTFGDIYANNWFRVNGATGIYWQSYGGGWYMEDTTWLRDYGGKPMFEDAGFDTGSGSQSGVACGGGMGGGYNFRVCGVMQVAGDLYSNNYYHNSDRRLKDNIKPIVGGLAMIDKLNGYTFNWKKDGTASAGVIAQEVQTVMPEAVSTTKENTLAVSYDELFAPMIEAVKQLHTMLVALETKVDTLVAEVQGHNDRIAKLEAMVSQLQAANQNSAKEVAVLRDQVKTMKSAATLRHEIKVMKSEPKAESATP